MSLTSKSAAVDSVTCKMQYCKLHYRRLSSKCPRVADGPHIALLVHPMSVCVNPPSSAQRVDITGAAFLEAARHVRLCSEADWSQLTVCLVAFAGHRIQHERLSDLLQRWETANTGGIGSM